MARDETEEVTTGVPQGTDVRGGARCCQACQGSMTLWGPIPGRCWATLGPTPQHHLPRAGPASAPNLGSLLTSIDSDLAKRPIMVEKLSASAWRSGAVERHVLSGEPGCCGAAYMTLRPAEPAGLGGSAQGWLRTDTPRRPIACGDPT